MEVFVSKASVSVMLLVLIVCSAEALNYLAFPRMGRSTSRAKRELPRYFIMPRKREFPKNFYVPRRSDSVDWDRLGSLAQTQTAQEHGYLAFPRMGRSKSESSSECCGLGLKSEFILGQDGKEELRAACTLSSVCCEGLREWVDQKPDGLYYSLCIPYTPLQSDSLARSSEVLGKFKSIMRK